MSMLSPQTAPKNSGTPNELAKSRSIRSARPLVLAFLVAMCVSFTGCKPAGPTFTNRSYAGGMLTSTNLSDWPEADNPGQVVDVFWPDPWSATNPPPPGMKFPTIVIVPGGFQGDHSSYSASRRFLASGIAVVKVSFRTLDTTFTTGLPGTILPGDKVWRTPAPWPQPAYDVDTAVRFLRYNSDKLHVDPDKIVLQAEAGGAFLVAAITAGNFKDPSSPIPATVSSKANGLVLVNGVYRIAPEVMADEVALTGRELIKRMIGCDPWGQVITPECAAAKAAAAPFDLVHATTQFPPTYFFHGEDDVPLRSREFVYMLCIGTSNPKVRLTQAPGVGHFYFPFGKWDYQNATGVVESHQEELDDFLVSIFGNSTTLDTQTPDQPLAPGERASCGY